MTSVPSSTFVRFLQLTALWAYSVAQPVFSFIGANPEFLVLRDTTPFETLGFALTLVLGPPLIAVAYASLAGLVSRWVRDMLHVVALAVFSVPLAFQIVKPSEPGRIAAVVLVAALGLVGVAAYVRWRAVRLFLVASAILPAFGLASFVHDLPAASREAHAAGVGIASPRPVVVVVFDELPVTSLMTRAGKIDGTRYPSFGRLARDATWYPNATTVHQSTTYAVPAILTGRLPRPGALPTYRDHPQNLFTLLGGGGYSLFVHEQVTRLCPADYCPKRTGKTLDRFDRMIEDVSTPYLLNILPRSITGATPGSMAADRLFGRAVETAVEDFEAFGDELSEAEPADSLHFVHVALPHRPWRYLPSGRRYGFADRLALDEEMVWLNNASLVRQGFQRHLLQLRYTDALLGRLLRRLVELGLYDRALLVIVADHGASFRAGFSRRAATDSNLADIAGVPLFVKYPGEKRGAVDRRSAKTIDVLPTIADVLGIPLAGVDGSTLRGDPPRREEAAVFTESGTRVRGPLASLSRQRRATIRRNAVTFGEGNDSLFRIGRNVQLLGKQVGTHWSPSASVRVRIEEARHLTNMQRASGFVPSHIAGVLEAGRIATDTELAVAVNGRIRALTRVYPDNGVVRFLALVPESALEEGYNRVDVYAIEGSGLHARLVRLGGSRPE